MRTQQAGGLNVVRSMTGWGRGEFTTPGADVYSVEVRSLNNRFIDMKVRLPERFHAFEIRVRDEIKKRFERGSFSVNVNQVSSAAAAFEVNTDVARAYLGAADMLKKELGVGGDINVGFLLKQKDILKSADTVGEEGPEWETLKAGLGTALKELDNWRVKEGEALLEDLNARLAEIATLVTNVEYLVPEVVKSYRQRLKEDMEKLLNGCVEESKIVLEAALFAQRTDVGEEIVRLKSHFSMFTNYLKMDEPVGKRLDFLCQEILRETNTIASKASDLRITQTIVEVKGLLEKIREQVQNVE